MFQIASPQDVLLIYEGVPVVISFMEDPNNSAVSVLTISPQANDQAVLNFNKGGFLIDAAVGAPPGSVAVPDITTTVTIGS